PAVVHEPGTHDVGALEPLALVLGDATLQRLHPVLPPVDALLRFLPCAVRPAMRVAHRSRRRLIARRADSGDPAAHLVRGGIERVSSAHRGLRGVETFLRVSQTRLQLIGIHAERFPSNAYRFHAPGSTRWNSSDRPYRAAILFNVAYFTPSC